MSENIRQRIDRLARGLFEVTDADEVLIFKSDDDFDSVSALQLILALEKEFDIVVEDDDICSANLGDLNCIARFVQAKLGGQ